MHFCQILICANNSMTHCIFQERFDIQIIFNKCKNLRKARVPLWDTCEDP